MTAYWGLFSIFALGALFRHGEDGERHARPLFVVAMIALALFVGLRWEIGPDWPAYRMLYGFLRENSFREVIHQSDPGFRSLIMVLQERDQPFWMLNLVC